MPALLKRHPAWTIAAVAVAVLAIAVASLLAVREANANARLAEICSQIHSVSEHLDEAPITEGDETVAVLGDSYSQGWSVGGPSEAWPATFGEQTDTTVYVDGFAGSGVTGSTFCPEASFAERVDEINRIQPDAVIIQAGLNDTTASSTRLREALAEVLDEIDADRVMVVGPPSPPARTAAALQRVEEAFAETAEDAGVQYVSLLDLDLEYQDDKLHTNRDGQRIIGETIAAAW
jgi:lysophospholipase L1-like esterase